MSLHCKVFQGAEDSGQFHPSLQVIKKEEATGELPARALNRGISLVESRRLDLCFENWEALRMV